MSKSTPKSGGGSKPTSGKDSLVRVLSPGGYTPADGGKKK